MVLPFMVLPFMVLPFMVLPFMVLPFQLGELSIWREIHKGQLNWQNDDWQNDDWQNDGGQGERTMNEVEIVAGWLKDARRAVAFTGAGISTESGVPDFRSPGGVWSKSQPVVFDEFLASETARLEYWRQKSVAHQDFMQASPNAGHRTLAAWQASGRLRAVITQNIDGLHPLAGNTDVVELHGTARYIACLQCRQRYDADPLVRQFLGTQQIPPCPACGGIMKHATISFGQVLDERVLERATQLASEADLLLAMGSSLVVYPAAALPGIARNHGARLVIINREATPHDSRADLVIRDSIGKTLVEINRCLNAQP
jgi:NAD-dependent deacetylase